MNSIDFALLLVRLAVGLTFAAHGAQKAFAWWGGPGFAKWQSIIGSMGFRPAGLFAAASVLAELVGGLMLAVGFLTPAAVMVLLGQTVVIIFKVHWAKGFFSTNGGYEFPLVLAVGAAAIGAAGPGLVSVDNLIHLQPTDPVRAALIIVGLLGGLATLALPKLFTRDVVAHAH
jgi:putative oxidoreductase